MKFSFVPARAGLATILAAMLVFALADRADAGCGCAACVSYQTVQKTIYVPQLVPETRTVHHTICEPEVRERVVTVHRCVPETKQVTQTYTVMVPHQKTEKQNYVVCKPVWNDVEQTYNVCIPQTEPRKGVRNVCRPVQVQETRTVTRNVCGWEDVPCDGSCGVHGAVVQKGGETAVQKGGCGGTHRVYVNKCVSEEVPVTVWKNEVHQEEYTYHVTTYRTEPRTRTIRVCNYVNETVSRDVTYTVCVPEQRSRTCNVTTYKTIAEPHTQQFTVMVPRTVEKQITVMVCHMVPKTITCTIPVYHHHGCGY